MHDFNVRHAFANQRAMTEYPSEQLDLFLDSGPSELERELTTALIAHRFKAARVALDSLMAVHPSRDEWQAFTVLVREGEALCTRALEPAEYLERLESRIMPACPVLGRRARAFLQPLWQNLARRLQDQRFQTSAPHCHASYAAMQAGEWGVVRSTIEREPEWHGQPLLLARRLEAAQQLGEQDLALEMLCRLCWVFPSEVDARLEFVLTRWFDVDYSAFRDLEVDLSIVDFPAWHALRRHRLLPVAQDLATHNAARTATAINDVLTEPPGTPNVDARHRLQNSHPTLFRLFMAQRRLELR